MNGERIGNSINNAGTSFHMKKIKIAYLPQMLHKNKSLVDFIQLHSKYDKTFGRNKSSSI